MTEPDVRVLVERVGHLAERVSTVAAEVAGCTGRIADLADRMSERFVPREVFEQERRANAAQHLDMQGDLARVAMQHHELLQKLEGRWEAEVTERHKRQQEIDARFDQERDRSVATRRWLVSAVVIPIVVAVVAVAMQIAALLGGAA